MPVPPHLHTLFDDAAVAHAAVDHASVDHASVDHAPVDRAVQAHLEHRRAWYGDAVRALVVPDPQLSQLASTRLDVGPGGLPVVVVVSGGAGSLEPAVVWATRAESLDLRCLQVTMRESDAGDLAPNARRIVAAVDALVVSGTLDEDVAVYVEPPPLSGPEPSPTWLSALDELAAIDHRLSLRTGGTGGTGDTDTALSSGRLAACIDAALDRELRLRFTGAHRALRHRNPRTGAERHGFLNLLVATRAGLEGASAEEMSRLLDETDAQVLTSGTDDRALASAHRWCTSFETDDVATSLGDLVGLGLLAER